jgi:hypothetical protein
VNLNFDNLVHLQQAAASAGIPFEGDSHLAQDRSVLKNLYSVSNQGRVGEGSLVRLAAFVINARYSNLSNGESVNCKKPGAENNDIHIVLGQNAIPSGQNPTEAEECASITAEISPHFRPDAWTPENLNSRKPYLFRFTGQLFFDASHRACSGSSGIRPRRSSIWEIHPVYAVDICVGDNNNCKVESDQDWVALSDSVGTANSGGETRLSLPDQIGNDSVSGAMAHPQSP